MNTEFKITLRDKTRFPVMVIGPGFHLPATILLAKQQKAILVIKAPSEKFADFAKTHFPETSIALKPMEFEFQTRFDQPNQKHWSKSERHNRKF